MIDYRKRHGIDLATMAAMCEISTALLSMLEGSEVEVTHHKIARKIGKVYGLTKEQTESLMPEHYRKSSPNYDPDLYRRQYQDDDVAFIGKYKLPKWIRNKEWKEGNHAQRQRDEGDTPGEL